GSLPQTFSFCGDFAEVHKALTGTRMQCAVEARPALLADLAFHTSPDLELGSRSEPFGGELAGSKSHAAGQVSAIDDQVPSGLIDTSEHDVRVRVVGIPVVHGDPLQPSTQVDFHPLHQ